MRVAVVVPCYDDGVTLEETLASLREQEEHELVVVDDGSTETETLAVLDRLRGRDVRVVRQENAGLSAARMAGVAATSAPYVMPLDADDLLEPGALAALADALDANPRAAVAWGDVTLFGDVEMRLTPAPALDAWWITYVNNVPGTSLVRRDALVAAGGWCMGSGYEDWDLWMSFAERGHAGVHVASPMLRYRRHGTRMLGDTIVRREDLVANLQTRHPQLFAQRRASWRRSHAPLRARLLLPVIRRMPLSTFDRHRLTLLVGHPVEIVRLRKLRRA